MIFLVIHIYPRWFVSPTATITRVSGSKIFVDNSTVFRVGQKLYLAQDQIEI